jgi:hypothetical protein
MRCLYAKFAWLLIGFSGVTGVPISSQGLSLPVLQSTRELFHHSLLQAITFS